MATEFTMPKLGLTMEEGTILQWLVPDGTEVMAGTAALVVETDKVETEVEAPATGVLRHVGAVGDVFRCGQPIAWLLAAGELAPVTVAPATVAPVAAAAPPATALVATREAQGWAAIEIVGRVLASPNAKRIAAIHGIGIPSLSPGSGPGGRVVSEDVEALVARRAAHVPSARPAASAAASQLAGLVGVDIAGVDTSAPDGRITRQDVADHVRTKLGSTSVAPVATQTPMKVIPLRGMRGTIASRMSGSLHEMAQLTLTMDVDMDAVFTDRETRKAAGRPPGYTDYVIAAVARALHFHPRLNSQITPDGIALLPDIHVGLAVALEEGLMVPVVRHADRLRLDAIAAETARLAEAARSGSLTLADIEGGTFSVSSLGMFGVDAFTPVINPPNVAILGVGRIRDDVVWVADGFRRVRRMTLSLTWDHRVLDGAPAAEFCQTIKLHLEDPTLIP